MMPSIWRDQSAPNWGSILTGSPPAWHGYFGNADEPFGRMKTLDGDGNFPSIFAALRHARRDVVTASFFE
jgi:hypothetical protein